jgi:tetratricopeptide (TPR) repeat protein
VAKLTIDQALQHAVDAHKAGQLQEAHRLYAAILKVQPKHTDANHNTGLLTVGFGKIELALPFFKTALETNPSIAQFWYSYIVALIKLERLTDAKALLNQAKSKGIKGADFDQLEQRLNDAEKTLSIKPNSADDYYNMGVVFQEQNRLGEAIKAYNKALSIKPDYTNALKNLSTVIKLSANMDKASEYNGDAISVKTEQALAHFKIGATFHEQNKLKEAATSYNRALSINPDFVEAYFNLGITLKKQGKLEQAIYAYKKVALIKPDFVDAYLNMGIIFEAQNKHERALEIYNKAISIKPDFFDAYNNIIVVLLKQSKLNELFKVCSKVLSINPDFASAYLNMGIAFQEQNKPKKAIEAYKRLLKIVPDCAAGHRNLSALINYKPGDPQIDIVNKLIKQTNISEDAKCHLHYTFAKINEDLSNLEVAFDNYVAGGKLRKKLLSYDIKYDQQNFKKIKDTSKKIEILSKKPIESLSQTPIFILGMPRSGTTLIEQIISSHSQVHGAGELTLIDHFGGAIARGDQVADLDSVFKFRRAYLEELKNLSDGMHFVTDKMPLNFLYIGIIMAALPEAKIIHVKRNPAATCWSNFKQYFSANGFGYSYSISDTVEYFRMYNDLMQFWDTLYGDKIYHLDYDKLTVDQEYETRALIEYCNLNWEEIFLSPQKNKRNIYTASQQQIRKKVYKGSSEVWRKFELQLNGSFDKLQN